MQQKGHPGVDIEVVFADFFCALHSIVRYSSFAFMLFLFKHCWSSWITCYVDWKTAGKPKNLKSELLENRISGKKNSIPFWHPWTSSAHGKLSGVERIGDAITTFRWMWFRGTLNSHRKTLSAVPMECRHVQQKETLEEDVWVHCN